MSDTDLRPRQMAQRPHRGCSKTKAEGVAPCCKDKRTPLGGEMISALCFFILPLALLHGASTDLKGEEGDVSASGGPGLFQWPASEEMLGGRQGVLGMPPWAPTMLPSTEAPFPAGGYSARQGREWNISPSNGPSAGLFFASKEEKAKPRHGGRSPFHGKKTPSRGVRCVSGLSSESNLGSKDTKRNTKRSSIENAMACCFGDEPGLCTFTKRSRPSQFEEDNDGSIAASVKRIVYEHAPASNGDSVFLKEAPSPITLLRRSPSSKHSKAISRKTMFTSFGEFLDMSEQGPAFDRTLCHPLDGADNDDVNDDYYVGKSFYGASIEEEEAYAGLGKDLELSDDDEAGSAGWRDGIQVHCRDQCSAMSLQMARETCAECFACIRRNILFISYTSMAALSSDYYAAAREEGLEIDDEVYAMSTVAQLARYDPAVSDVEAGTGEHSLDDLS